MRDTHKRLLRAFYQGLATEEEKAAVRLALTLNGKERREQVARLIALNIPMDMEIQAIILYSDLSSEELIALFALEVRKRWLARIWYWLFGGA